MVSVGWSLAGRESMLGILGRWLTRRRREVVALLAVAVRFTLIVAGFTTPIVGIWMQFGPAVGLIAAGPALLVVEFFVKRR